MSQSGRLTLNQPVPGAGIETLTGNVGGAVPGDGAANIDLVGLGTITVTGHPGINTLTITSTATPATYTTNDANVVVPDGAGNVNVFGDDVNIYTTGATAHTVNVALGPNVTIAGTFTSGGNITTTGGNVAVPGGSITTNHNVIAQGVIHGVAGGQFDDTVGITAGGIDSIGPTILESLTPNAVVQTDGTSTLFANNGADGQLLTGQGIGIAPAWANIIAGNADIVIGYVAPNITVEVAGSVPSMFVADAGNAIPAANILNISGGSNINTAGAGHTVTVNLNHNIGITGNIVANGSIGAGTNIVAGTDIAATTFISAPLVTTTDIDIAAAPNGSLVTNGAGTVSAINAPIGSVLAGTGTGVTPAFSTLTAGAGIAINTATPHNITISATGAINTGFRASLLTGVPYAANSTTPAYVLGTLQALVLSFDNTGGFYIGDGINAPATFTVPTAGSYYFTLYGTIGSDGIGVALTGAYSASLSINNTTHPSITSYSQTNNAPFTNVNYQVLPRIVSYLFSELIYCYAGDIITFTFYPQLHTNMANRHLQIGPDYTGAGIVTISGFMVNAF